jgi:hypothetical protein
MFSNRPRKPISILPQRKQTQSEDLLSHFRTQEGEFDIEKILDTAYQIKGVYDQFSPFLTKFIKK